MKHNPSSSVRKGFNQKKDVRAIARERVGAGKAFPPYSAPHTPEKAQTQAPARGTGLGR
jgi:hypothetical protein